MTSFGRPSSNKRGRARYSVVVMTLCGVSALGRSRGWSTRMTQPVMGGSLSRRAQRADAGRSCVRGQTRHQRLIAGYEPNGDCAGRDVHYVHHQNRFARASQAVPLPRPAVADVPDRAASRSAEPSHDRHNNRGACRTAGSRIFHSAQSPACCAHGLRVASPGAGGAAPPSRMLRGAAARPRAGRYGERRRWNKAARS